jgi:hypothetical protein
MKMKRGIVFLVFAVLMSVSSGASAHDLDRDDPPFSVFGGFVADVSNGAMGGVFGLEFKLCQKNHLVLALAPRVAVMQGQTPITIGVNPGIETMFVDATSDLRLRVLATNWLSLVGNAGLGLRAVQHNDAIVDEYRMIEGGSHQGFLISWGLALEFRVSARFRLSAFYQGGLSFNQLVALGMRPTKKNTLTHKLGAMLSLHF